MRYQTPIAAVLIAFASASAFAAGTADTQVTQVDRYAEAGGTNDNYGISGVVVDQGDQPATPAGKNAEENARRGFDHSDQSAGRDVANRHSDRTDAQDM